MPLQLFACYLKLPIFALVLARLGGLLLMQPVLGAAAVPVRLRLLLIVGLAALMTPLIAVPSAMPDDMVSIGIAFGGELLLGAILGLVGAICFLGLQLGGLMIAMESGLAFGQIVNPATEEDENVLGTFYLQLAVVVYLILGGHRALIGACLDTFDTIPLLCGTTGISHGPDLLVTAVQLSCELAFRVAAPALLALFLVNLALGFIGRTMPQLNILAVGFSLKTMIAFMFMAVALPAAMEGFIDVTEDLYGWLNDLVNH